MHQETQNSAQGALSALQFIHTKLVLRMAQMPTTQANHKQPATQKISKLNPIALKTSPWVDGLDLLDNRDSTKTSMSNGAILLHLMQPAFTSPSVNKTVKLVVASLVLQMLAHKYCMHCKAGNVPDGPLSGSKYQLNRPDECTLLWLSVRKLEMAFATGCNC